jgi:hypothetical protein
MVRGLAGLREPSPADAGPPLSLSPQLPSQWSWLRLRRVHWRDAVYDISIVRGAGGFDVSVSNAGRTQPLLVTLALEPGATVEKGTAAVRFTGRTGPETAHVSVRPGITIDPVEEPLRTGDFPQRLRILRTSFEAGRYVARVQGLSGRTYTARLRMPFDIAGVEGGTVIRDRGGIVEMSVPFEGAGSEWVSKVLSIMVTRRR